MSAAACFCGGCLIGVMMLWDVAQAEIGRVGAERVPMGHENGSTRIAVVLVGTVIASQQMLIR